VIIQKLKILSRSIKKQLTLYRLVLKDKRTPFTAKLLLGAAIGYLLLPFDLIPDFIPFFGQLDDLIIVPLLVYLALKLIPKNIIEEYKIELNYSAKV
jgi:uncharacterized membrane protein YkvA (DUF1232 family)